MNNKDSNKTEQMELFSKLVSQIPMLIYVLDKHWNFKLSEGAALSKIGLKPGEVVGKSARELYKDNTNIISSLDQAYKGIDTSSILKLDDLYLEHYIAPYYNKNNEIDGVVGAAIDVTNRLKSEDELQKTRELQNAILESVPGMIYMYNDLGELLFWNKWHETMTGYNKEELYLKKFTDWFENDEQSLAAINQGLQDMKTKGFGETEAYLECKDKTKIPLYFTARLFKLDGKDYFVGMGVDISNRVAAENKLKVLNHTLEEKVIERTQELSDANIELSEVNQELTAMNEEMQAMNEELSNSNEKMIKMQNFLVESEKMASLGGLVAGVAHEINTPIGIGMTASTHLQDMVNDLLDLNKERPLTSEDIIPYLEDIDKATHMIYKNLNRAATLIKSFKQLSVDQSTEPKRLFDLCEYTNEVLLSLSPSMKKTKIKINTICKEPVMINGYPGSLAQVITNLVMNSLKHGYLAEQEGIITIEINRKDPMIEIVYKDDGVGIDNDIIDKIFEPFFTTNRSNGGTGLGLSIIYSIITQQYKGSIKCDSEKGKGVKFTIYIKEDII